MLGTLFRDKRIIIGIVLLAGLALSFWSGSRVPQLSEKAAMGTEVDINALGFDTVFTIQPEDSIPKQIIYTTVNWMDTNKKGMTFGVLFASILMTLFSLFRRRSFNNSFGNSALGLVIGTPLGVCVNCAAPIAAGMAAAGTRLETTLATMISSPTMNVIVLTMLFSLFPMHLIIIKIGFSLAFILVVIPILCRYVFKREAEASTSGGKFCGITANNACPIPTAPIELDESSHDWLLALRWIVINFFKSLWFVFRMTVPLMILAGFLGAVMITMLPWDSLSDIVPSEGFAVSLLGMAIIAIVGVFLPVPIAFDVIICAIMLAAGMPVKYVMVLLFTLGIFSIYSYFIVLKSVSNRVALSMAIVIAGMGVVAGITGHYWDRAERAKNRQLLLEFFVQNENEQQITYYSDKQVKPDSAQAAPELIIEPEQFTSVQAAVSLGINIERSKFHIDQQDDLNRFKKVSAKDLGIQDSFRFTFFKLFLPFTQSHGRAITTGDVQNDGWTDIVFVIDASLALYLNQAGRGFVKQELELGELHDRTVGHAALVDLNNDGWQDIYFTTYEDGNYAIYNDRGQYRKDMIKQLPSLQDVGFTTSSGFGDIDRDGDLDIFMGVWSIAWGNTQWLSSKRSKNTLLEYVDGSFIAKDFGTSPGAPTSNILTDFNNDNRLDLIIGNDFDPPDLFFTSDEEGRLNLINRSDNKVEGTTRDTMSIVSADIDNDLQPELYMSGIARYPGTNRVELNTDVTMVCKELEGTEFHDRCLESADMHRLFSRIILTKNVKECYQLKDRNYANECVLAFFIRRSKTHGGADVCRALPQKWSMALQVCETNLQTPYQPSQVEINEGLTQIVSTNVFLVKDEENRFNDKAADYGIEYAGFTWNAKFADVDHDGWQDLFAANGSFRPVQQRESNYFFHNQQGKKFINKTEEFGLKSHLATSAYSYIDIENDGDLDIVTVPMNGPVGVYLNTLRKGNSITFELRDRLANSHGIGSKVFIYYGDNEEYHQMREFKASGGYLSFDAPIVHFGLGEYSDIKRAEIVWSTGERTEIRTPLQSGYRYRISRHAAERLSMN